MPVPRNAKNSFFQQKNHVLLAREDKTKALILDSGVARATALGKTIGAVGGGAGPTSFSDISANLSPEMGGGFVKRNPDYTGPACLVANALDYAETTEIDFDADGFVTAARPYGDNTRVMTVYDQYAANNFVAPSLTAGGAPVIEPDGTYKCWTLNSNTTTYQLFSPFPNAGTWDIMADVLWAVGLERGTPNGLQNPFGCGPNGGWLEWGLWVEWSDLNWRINQSAAQDWPNTNRASFGGASFQTVIGDCTQQDGNGYGYYNGVLQATLAYTRPFSYDSSARVGIGDTPTIGDPFVGRITEVVAFDRVSSAVADDIAAIDTALREALVA